MRGLRPAELAVVMAAVATLSAHDCGIEASGLLPGPGSGIGSGLRAGQGFVGDPVRRPWDLIEQFIVRQGDREAQDGGSEGSDPAGIIIADGRETAVIAYRSKAAYVELPADRFEEYL